MRDAHPREETVGIEWYASDAPGVGGTLRTTPEDFHVREVETVEPAPLGSDTGDYAHLLIRATLRRWDTNDFAARLSDALEMSRERVSWAGTKDKHAVTTQLFSVQGVTVDALDGVDIDGADIEPVGRFGRALQFGDLAGNEFVVRVRELDCDTDTARERVDQVEGALHRIVVGEDDERNAGEGDEKEKGLVGVPNYFGHQRFGSRRPVTHLVGLHVVRGEWREAVRAYCGNPAEAEREETQEARAIVDEEFASESPDWQRALDAVPGYLRYERSMLHRLTEPREPDENDTERAEDARFRHALEAVPSNLQRLFVNAAQSYVFNRIVSERLRRGLPLATPVEGDVVCFTDRDVDEAFAVPDTDRDQRVTEKRVDVMARHCARGRAFVTAPLVGTETELAAGEPGDIEREILDDLNLSPADFSLPGAFDSTGTRRAILVRTRLDASVDDEGLDVDFALPRGSYATVVLREFTKADPLDL